MSDTACVSCALGQFNLRHWTFATVHILSDIGAFIPLHNLFCITPALSSIENKDKLKQWLWDDPREFCGKMAMFLRLTLTIPSVTVIWKQVLKQTCWVHRLRLQSKCSRLPSQVSLVSVEKMRWWNIILLQVPQRLESVLDCNLINLINNHERSTKEICFGTCLQYMPNLNKISRTQMTCYRPPCIHPAKCVSTIVGLAQWLQTEETQHSWDSKANYSKLTEEEIYNINAVNYQYSVTMSL